MTRYCLQTSYCDENSVGLLYRRHFNKMLPVSMQNKTFSSYLDVLQESMSTLVRRVSYSKFMGINMELFPPLLL
jgi:hypothetical protein